MKTTVSERHVTAAQARRRRKLTDSEAIFANAETMRLRKPVLVKGVRRAGTVTLIQPDEHGKLHIDERYQRPRVGQEVNDLIYVLTSGGQIADPIDVAQRTDGSWWIIDGQQRFWAHRETEKALPAHIHLVDSYEAEVNLFYALNSRTALTSKNVVKGWPGPAGEFIRRMNASDKSALKGMINLTNDSSKPIDGAILARCLLVLLTGISPTYTGNTATSLMPKLDTALKQAGAVAWAEAYCQLLAVTFGPSAGKGGRRVRILPMLALARVARRKFLEHGRIVFPKVTSRLQRVNWDNVVPTHALKYLSDVEEKIERNWK